MGGDSRFSFRSTSLTRWHLALSATGFCLQSEAAKGNSKYSKSWDVKFAEVDVATLHEWTTRKASGEAVYFRTTLGRTAMFSTTTNAMMGKDVTEDDRSTYRAAAAAVFRAYAAACPDARVRRGRTPGYRLGMTIVLAIQTALLVALYLWQTGEMSDTTRYTVLAAIVAMMVLYGVYRLKLLQKPVFVPVGEIAAELAQRTPQTGPWGAAPAGSGVLN